MCLRHVRRRSATDDSRQLDFADGRQCTLGYVRPPCNSTIPSAVNRNARLRGYPRHRATAMQRPAKGCQPIRKVARVPSVIVGDLNPHPRPYIERPIRRAIDLPIGRPIYRLTDPSSDRSNDRSTPDGSTDRSTDRSTDWSTDRSSDRRTDRSTVPSTETTWESLWRRSPIISRGRLLGRRQPPPSDSERGK